MYRITGLAFLLVVLVASCDDGVSPTSALQEDDATQLIAAKNGTEVYRDLIDEVHFNECSGEDVHTTGFNLWFLILDEEADTWIWHSSYVLQGVGLSTGWEYMWLTNNQEEALKPKYPEPFPWTYTYTRTRRVISKGNAPDQLLTVRAHIIVDANGEVTVDRYETEFICR